MLASTENDPINLGNPSEMTVLDFAKLVQKLSGTCSEIVFVKPQDERTKDDPTILQPDIGKARRVLRWEPQVGLEEGLSRTIEYFRRLFSQERP